MHPKVIERFFHVQVLLRQAHPQFQQSLPETMISSRSISASVETSIVMFKHLWPGHSQKIFWVRFQRPDRGRAFNRSVVVTNVHKNHQNQDQIVVV